MRVAPPRPPGAGASPHLLSRLPCTPAPGVASYTPVIVDHLPGGLTPRGSVTSLHSLHTWLIWPQLVTWLILPHLITWLSSSSGHTWSPGSSDLTSSSDVTSSSYHLTRLASPSHLTPGASVKMGQNHKMPGHLDTWSPSHLDTWTPGHLVTCLPVHLDTLSPGHLDT